VKPLPDFLSEADVLDLHVVALEAAGGRIGVRDAGLLASAVAAPQAGMGDRYLHDDIPTMAAAYLYHLIRNHPFVDGNKRVGMLAYLTFPDLNEYRCTLPEDEWIMLVMAIARAEVGKDEVINRLRPYCLSPTQ
jgi:death on curing protein